MDTNGNVALFQDIHSFSSFTFKMSIFVLVLKQKKKKFNLVPFAKILTILDTMRII